jgi:hypothetical protein
VARSSWGRVFLPLKSSMSNRSIIEINHDFAARIENDRDEFMLLLLNAIRSGRECDWEMLGYFGVRFALMAHHSDDRAVVVNKTTYPFK